MRLVEKWTEERKREERKAEQREEKAAEREKRRIYRVNKTGKTRGKEYSG